MNKKIKYLLTVGCSVPYGCELQYELDSSLNKDYLLSDFKSWKNFYDKSVHTPFNSYKYSKFELHRRKNKFSNIVAKYFNAYDLNASIPGSNNSISILSMISFVERFKQKRSTSDLFIIFSLTGETRFPVVSDDWSNLVSVLPMMAKIEDSEIVDNFKTHYQKISSSMKKFIYDDYYNIIFNNYRLLNLIDNYCTINNINYVIIPTVNDIDFIDKHLKKYNKEFKNLPEFQFFEKELAYIPIIHEPNKSNTLIKKIFDYSPHMRLNEDIKLLRGPYHHPLSKVHRMMATDIIKHINMRLKEE